MPVLIQKSESFLKKAVFLQKKLAARVEIIPITKARHVVAVDAAYLREDERMIAGAAVMDIQEGTVREEKVVTMNVPLPYIPGYLSFREAPAMLKVLHGLDHPFDVIMCDGQGIAHPRRCGLATHIGVLLNKPSIGVAKKRLVGEYHPVSRRGEFTPLRHKGEIIGAVVCTRTGVKPVFVSVGNKILLNQAIAIVMESCAEFRLPEPLRRAHLLCEAWKRAYELFRS